MAIHIESDKSTTDHGWKPRSGRGGIPQKDYRASSVVSQRNPCKVSNFKTTRNIKIATWNAQSMYQAGKFDNIIKEMSRLNLGILGISDTQWPGAGERSFQEGMFYYSGNDDPQHRYGVGIFVKQKIVKSIVNIVRYSDRIIMLQLKIQNGKINVVQIYAPTADKPEQEIEDFYEDLNSILKTTKKQDITIVMGDFNAKIGEGRVDQIVGEHGLGVRNERGERLIEYCQQNQLIITNTWFKLPKRRLYTWTAPSHTSENIVRNQIDFILISQRYRNAIKSVKTYPGADIKSDHNPLVAAFKITFKKLKRKVHTPRINTELLKEDKTRLKVKQDINRSLKNKENYKDVNAEWKTIKERLLEVGHSNLIDTKRPKKQRWMTNEILDLMEDRRNQKGKDMLKYREIDKIIKRKITEAKETFMLESCKEIEELEKKYDTFGMHKKIKEITGLGRKKSFTLIKDRRGKLILDTTQKIKRWEEYVKELFDDIRTEIKQDIVVEGPPITKDEVIYAIKCAKEGRAPGPDSVPVELLKLIEYEQLHFLVDLYNTIYNTGIIPSEWLQSAFVMLPKKPYAKECSDYRTISLMSHTLKVFLKIIHNRIHCKLEADMSESQFGFRKGLGTREALFAVNVLIQKCLDMNKEICLGFIDYEKAFDRVRHDKLFDLLDNSQLDNKDIRIIKNLYWNQTAVIRDEGKSSEDIKIMRGVRQGCVLSPLLFNYYSDAIFKEALNGQEAGVKINGILINNIRYADDTLIVADSIEDLQTLLQEINRVSNEYGLRMNFKKTKYMLISRTPSIHTNIRIESTSLERVSKYQYLGAWINEKHDQAQEISSRIQQAKTAFFKMRQLYADRNLNLQLRLRMAKCYVIPILLYGLEAWTLNKATMGKLEAFEMWIYRRIMRISWTQRISNEEVLRRVNKERELINEIKTRKLEYFGHVIRGERYNVLQLIMEGKIEGRRPAGRRRTSWLRNLREWFGCTSIQLFRAAVSKITIARMIANLRRETAP